MVDSSDGGGHPRVVASLMRAVPACVVTIGFAVGVFLAAAIGSQADPAAAQAAPSATHQISCLADNGRVDVWATNPTADSVRVTVSLTGLADRVRDVAPDTTQRFTITGRPDADYRLRAQAGDSVLIDETVTVGCDPPAPEVSIGHSCLANDGRVDILLSNSTRSELTYAAAIGTLAPRSVVVAGEGSGRVTATGRRDGPLQVDVSRSGQVIATEVVEISCDELLPDGLEATLSQGCLGENGFFRIDVANRSGAAAIFQIEISGLEPRERTVDAGRAGRFMVTGRPDDRYTVTVRRGDVVVLDRADVVVACDPIQYLVPQVLRTVPHDRGAFTQGLVVDAGRVFESTGAPSGFTSSVRELDPATGEVLRSRDFGTAFFGEGLAVVGERLYFLSWLEQVVRVLERDSDPGEEPFQSVESFSYEGQGWGLCFDGTDLVMSNGTADLTFRDPVTFEVRRQVTVTRDGVAVIRLNELECVDGNVWANVWLTDEIIEIEPLTGLVRSVVDASQLEQPRPTSSNAVLNGIAWDPDAGHWLVTGKEWPTLYEVEFVPSN